MSAGASKTCTQAARVVARKPAARDTKRERNRNRRLGIGIRNTQSIISMEFGGMAGTVHFSPRSPLFRHYRI